MKTLTSRNAPGAMRDRAPDDAFVEALAAELELDVATVADALEAAHAKLRAQVMAERLEELERWLVGAVDDGKLSPEQAGAILAGSEDGVLPFRGGPSGSRRPAAEPTDPDPAA